MHYIDYLSHTIYEPDTFHRNFENDIPLAEEEVGGSGSTVKRVALCSLPFFALYRSFGYYISVGMGATKSVSHLFNAVNYEERGEYFESFKEVLLVAVAVVALASTLFSFTLGLLLSTIADFSGGAIHLATLLQEQKYTVALEELVQLSATGLYLGFMFTNVLEYMLLFALFQAAGSGIQAKNEFQKGHYIEAFAKFAMGCVRGKQVDQYYRSIQQRNQFLEIKKYRNLYERGLRGRQVRHLLEHPLKNLQVKIQDQKAILVDPDGNEFDFGSNFHGFGKQLVKGDNIAFYTRKTSEGEVIELEFKVNHVFREKLYSTNRDILSLKQNEISEVLRYSGSHATAIKVVEDTEALGENGIDYRVDKLIVQGIGEVFVGQSASNLNLYDKVVVRLNPGKNLFDLFELTALAGLDEALSVSTAQDLERLKLGHLYRTFFPREATPFERSEEFFTLPLDQVKERMIEKNPEMSRVIDDYYSSMTPEEIIPGRVRYQMHGLGERAREKGARALTAALTGVYQEKDLYQRTASILSMGLMSTETRENNGISSHGLGGSGIDYYTGGADSVYTQMITQHDVERGMRFNEFNYNSRIRVLFSVDALEMGTYQSYDDSFGNRICGEDAWWWSSIGYEKRPSILEFIESQNTEEAANSWDYGGHEVMFKERIDPKYITGIVVDSTKTQEGLSKYLFEHGIDFSGKIHVASKVSKVVL